MKKQNLHHQKQNSNTLFSENRFVFRTEKFHGPASTKAETPQEVKDNVAKPKVSLIKAQEAAYKALRAYEKNHGGIPGVSLRDPKTSVDLIQTKLDAGVTGAAKIRQLEAVLKAYKALKEATTYDDRLTVAYANIIETRDRGYRAVEKKKALFAKGSYPALRQRYQNSFDTLMGSNPRFKRFFTRSIDQQTYSGEVALRKSQETKNLFFSILAAQSNNFKDFILPNFSKTDWEANAKKYPFIFEQFINSKFTDSSRQRLAKMKGAIDAEKASLGLTKVADIVAKVKQRVKGINRVYGRDPNLEIPDYFDKLTPTTTNIKSETYYNDIQDALSSTDRKIDSLMDALKKKGDPKSMAAIEQLKKDQKNFSSYHKLAGSQARWMAAERNRENLSKDFVLDKLNTPTMQQFMIKQSMLKLQQAMEMVDFPNGLDAGGYQNKLHPRVRLYLIATAYREGVGYYKGNDFMLDKGREYRGVLNRLVSSDYFNRNVSKLQLNAEQRDFLLLARMTGKAEHMERHIELKIIKELREIAKKLTRKRALNVKRSSRTADENREFDSLSKEVPRRIKAMNGHLKYANLNANLDEDSFLLSYDNLINLANRQKKNWETFRKEADILLKSPNQLKIREYIEQVKAGRKAVGLPGIDKAALESHSQYIREVDVNYSTFEREEKSKANYLELMGITPQSIYDGYKSYLDKHPELSINHWDDLMTSRKGILQLREMFQNILPMGKNKESRAAFLHILGTLKDGRTSLDPKLRNVQSAVREMVTKIKEDIQHRARLEGSFSLKAKEVMQKLNGSTIADKGSEYIRGVFDMAIGPGQSIANRAAGFILIAALAKGIQKAWRNEGKTGQALRIFAIATAVELWMKQNLAGGGVLDRAGYAGVSEALKGSNEDVLLQLMNRRKVEKVTQNEHGAMLIVMRDVPMVDLMRFYEATNEHGLPKSKDVSLNNRNRSSFGPAALPRQIKQKINKITNEKGVNKEAKVKYLLRKTMENLFAHVAKNKGGEPQEGYNIIKKAYIDPINHPDIMGKLRGDYRRLSPELVKKYSQNKKALTWKKVLESEIHPDEATKEFKKKIENWGYDYAKKGLQNLETWTRETLRGRVGPGAHVFWERLTKDEAPKIEKFLLDAGKAGAKQLRYGADYVTFKYKEHQHTLRRLAGNVWEFAGHAVTIPVYASYRVLDWTVAMANMKARQGLELFSRSRSNETYITTDRVPNERDVVNKREMRNLFANPDRLNLYEISDITRNPEYKLFGRYQLPFYEAALKTGSFPKDYEVPNDNSSTRAAILKGFPGTKYSIIETDFSEVKDKSGGKDVRKSKLRALARQRAFEHFSKKYGVSMEDLKFLDPIHFQIKVDKNGMPQKIYGYWRLPGSKELLMKHDKRWTGPYDANRSKFTPPFLIDQRKGLIENLKIYVGLRNKGVRRVGRLAGAAGVQWVRAALGLLRIPGAAVATSGRIVNQFLPTNGLQFLDPILPKGWAAKVTKGLPIVGNVASELSNAIANVTRWTTNLTHRSEYFYQAMDELSGAPLTRELASSAFYQRSARNLRLYNLAVNIAIAKKMKVADVLASRYIPGKVDASGNRVEWNWEAVTYRGANANGSGRGSVTIRRPYAATAAARARARRPGR